MSQVRAMATGTSTTMLRARRKDINVKPNRRLDRRSSRGMIFENEELRLRTISINAEVEKGQNDIKKLRRENEQLRREIWGLRDEYDRLEQLLAKLQHHQQNSGSEEENEEEGELEQEQEHESDGNGTVAENARNQQKMSRELSGETEDGEEEGEPAERIAAELVAAHRVHELCARVGGPRCRAGLCFRDASASPSPPPRVRALFQLDEVPEPDEYHTPPDPNHSENGSARTVASPLADAAGSANVTRPKTEPAPAPTEPDVCAPVGHYPPFPVGGNLEQLLLEEQGKRSNVCGRVSNETVKQPVDDQKADTAYLVSNGSEAAATEKIADQQTQRSNDVSNMPPTTDGVSAAPQNCIEKSSSSPCLSTPKFRSEIHIQLQPPAGSRASAGSSVGVSASASTSDIHQTGHSVRKFCSGPQVPDVTATSHRPTINGTLRSREASIHRDNDCARLHAGSRSNTLAVSTATGVRCNSAVRGTESTDAVPGLDGATTRDLATGSVDNIGKRPAHHVRMCSSPLESATVSPDVVLQVNQRSAPTPYLNNSLDSSVSRGRKKAGVLRLSCDWPADGHFRSASTPCTPLHAHLPPPPQPASADAAHVNSAAPGVFSKKPEGPVAVAAATAASPGRAHKRANVPEDARLHSPRSRSPVPWCSCWGNGCI